MPTFQVLQHAMNVGVVDEDKLHRVDLERMRLAAQMQTNWVCDSVGRMFLRPGSTKIGSTPAGAQARIIPFVAAQSAAYILELTNNALRIYFQDILLSRPAVTAALTAPDFSAGTGWVLANGVGETSAIAAGKLNLSARAHGAKAFAKQQLTINEQGVEHAIRVVVERGPVNFRVGATGTSSTTAANVTDELISNTTLDTGTHSLAFIPASATVWVQMDTILPRTIVVDSCTIEAAGVVSLPTIWPTAAFGTLRPAQSLDVMYVAAGLGGLRQQKIERRGDNGSAGHSWSVTDYRPEDGPFLAAPTSTAKLTPGALEGNTTLTSDIPFFKAGHVGALFRLYHEGQAVDTYLAGASTFTPVWEVTGINEPNINDRFFVYTISGTWVGTLRNQRSFDSTGTTGFHDYRDKQTSTNVDLTANVGPYTNDDDDDNAICQYRIGFPAGKYTSGEAHIVSSYGGGGGFGVGRVTAYTSPTSVNIEVLSPFAGSTATDSWLEGSWSDVRGYPTAVVVDDGRLVWAGADKLWESISDAYQAFDIDFVGDAGPIDRAIALGGRNEARWMLPLWTNILGCDARIARAGGSALDEAVTPSNLTIRDIGRIGAAAVDPAQLRDNRALFVEQSGKAVYEIDYVYMKGGYVASEFSKLSKELFQAGITEMVVQARPDQRVHCTTSNGDAIMIIEEPEQQVTSFIPISTSYATDIIESQCVLPALNTLQDQLYRSVKRVVNGATVRFIEKVALDDETKPRTICKVMDAGLQFGAGAAIITGLNYLEGRTVVVWMDGAPVTDPLITDKTLDDTMQFVVTGGQITLPRVPVTGGFVGLPYTARYMSGRLAYGVGQSSPVLDKMSIAGLGLLLADYCRSGVRFGTKFDDPDHPLLSMPELNEKGQLAPEVVLGVGKDEYPIPMDGAIGFDERVCIEARSPKTVSVLALLLGINR